MPPSFFEAIRSTRMIVSSDSPTALLVTAALLRQDDGLGNPPAVRFNLSMAEWGSMRENHVIAVDFGVGPEDLDRFVAGDNQLNMVIVGRSMNWSQLLANRGLQPLMADWERFPLTPGEAVINLAISSGHRLDSQSLQLLFAADLAYRGGIEHPLVQLVTAAKAMGADLALLVHLLATNMARFN